MNIIVADASETTLPDACASKVYGEAMLTMQPRNTKAISVNARILKPGGFYGIHELGLQPDHISDDIKQSVYKDLSANIRVHARPLTVAEWSGLLKDEGFKIITVHTNAMALLEPKRVLQDEGIFRTLKIGLNVLIHGDLRKRVFQMRRTFRKHKDDINAVAIVAQKQ